MNALKKFIVAVLLCCVVFTGIPVTALAETDKNTKLNTEVSFISPRLTYIDDAQAAIEIENGIATVDCWVKGDIFNATKAKVIAELQLKSGSSWMAYGTWTNTQNDYEAYVYETKSVKAGQTYRVTATVTVWEGSQSESLVLYTDEMTA